uniref:Uncharacterized protein n=1 Tax=Pseudo-nitzschia australis TaxID=44445 RepID=A0A7S4AT22_9STRA|mmetsp:Transcript_9556/g.20663  ORF Transcript_9556/g.20663 Transcript_9556/m.20663 type:complete len:678 (+) Transcript_9556:58-2091(+)|eukprot:CAMPEP_0168193652 /NCGR_PEP_ID=MMETSP0139_2-20121125/18726_1 /TAXON_ID=44445 /ORGANISM="Pseudo-nitzschia australis, Strain 10249 10 AB" /LENGTH=677 /DNA_ID=CAMNT_0008117033 /DNA_START=10 /DNA_END=2043 /DNA_ORIENTATION=+
MKFGNGICALLLTGGIATSDAMSIRGSSKHAHKLMAFSRRLEDGGSNDGSNDEANDEANDDANDESYTFLKDMSIKLLSCIQGEQMINYENDETETSTVIFRLCPADSCSSDSLLGCNDGYGDYAVGMNTFLYTYMESVQENDDQNNGYVYSNGYGYSNSMIAYSQYGQAFDASDYMECTEYTAEQLSEEEQEEGEQEYQEQQKEQQYYNGAYQNDYQGQYNGNRNEYNPYQDSVFFIGPSCTEDGTSIALNMYIDQYCTYPAEIDFTQVSPGWRTLPFSDYLIKKECMSCYVLSEDYEMVVSDLCLDDYASSVYSCESNMAASNYDGDYHYPATEGCDYIDSLLTSVYGNQAGTRSNFFTKTTKTTTNATNTNRTKWETVGTAVSNAGKKAGSAVGSAAVNAAQTAKSRFMDTMSTEEARAFVVAMVFFAISAALGATFIGCLCVKKQRKRRRAKKMDAAASSQLLADDDGDDDEVPPPPESIKKRRSSVVALVRTATNSMRQSVKAAATGTKKNISEPNKGDDTMKSEYSEHLHIPPYKAPKAAPSSDDSMKSSNKSLKSFDTVITEPDPNAETTGEDSVKLPVGDSIEVAAITESTREKAESNADETSEQLLAINASRDGNTEEASPEPAATTAFEDETPAEQIETPKTPKSKNSFLSKMDKHLKKKSKKNVTK